MVSKTIDGSSNLSSPASATENFSRFFLFSFAKLPKFCVTLPRIIVNTFVMKNIVATILFVFAVMAGFAQQQLPAEASQTIATFFPQSQISAVSQYDASAGEFAYRADLDSDIILYFDANGRWMQVESFSSDISQFLPAEVKTSIEQQGCRPQNVVNIHRVADGTLVIIYNDGLAHRFETNGNFMGKVSR